MTDVATGGQCTGQCCTDITLRAGGGRGAVLAWFEVSCRQKAHAQQMASENHLERFLAPAGDHLTCAMYDHENKRCSIYAERPETCRTYPRQTIQNGELSNTCRFCGFTAET